MEGMEPPNGGITFSRRGPPLACDRPPFDLSLPSSTVVAAAAVAAAATVNACRWCHLPSLLPPGAAALLLTRLPQLPADDHHVAVPLLRSQHNAEVSLDADNLWTFEFDGGWAGGRVPG